MAEATLREELVGALGLLTPVGAPGLDKIRLGNDFDGGYVMAGGALLAAHAAYSFGIGPDVSFDLELARLGIPVRMFDHTVEGPGTRHELFTFHKQGLGTSDDPAQSLFTLEHHLRSCGDWGRTDLLLKIDVEGAEIPAFAQCGPGILRHFRQIVLELHWLNRLAEPAYRAEFVAAMTALAAGFHIVHVHANNCVPIYLLESMPVAGVVELTLVRKDLITPEPSRTVYPTEFDFANNPVWPDYTLWFYPFLPGAGPAETAQSLAAIERSRQQYMASPGALPAATSPFATSPPAATPPVMTDEAMVRALYQLVLRREADPDGLRAYVAAAAATPDKSFVLASMLESAEYALGVQAGTIPGVDRNGLSLPSIRPVDALPVAALPIDALPLDALKETIRELLPD